MTLLKVLYFAHAWHLAKTGNPLVAQPFEAWKHGPVSRVVYDQYKGFGRRPIDKKAESFDPILLKFVQTPYFFDADTTAMLNNVFDYFIKFRPFQLSELTHEKGSPWDIIWSEAQNRAVPGMFIPNNLILSWFQRSELAIKHIS
jgi:uncharacterized phage-associated protein